MVHDHLSVLFGVILLHTNKQTNKKRSYECEVLVLLEAVGVFVQLKQLSQMFQVNFMKRLDVLAARTGSLCDRDRLPH